MAIRQCIGWSLEALSELSRKADFWKARIKSRSFSTGEQINGSQGWNLLFTLFEESLLYSITMFDEKARKKVFLLFHLKEVQTQFNSEQYWRVMFSKFEIWKDRAKLT